MARKRPRVEPTDDFQEILPLCWWPEQVEYERIRQPVLFGTSVTERAEQTGVSRRTLQRRIARFGEEGMEGLFQTEAAKKQKLPPNIRRFIVDLKAEYPPFNLNEIANVVRAWLRTQTGRPLRRAGSRRSSQAPEAGEKLSPLPRDGLR